MSATTGDPRVSLQQALAWVVATFAVAGGLIHLKASFDHRDLALITVGFAAMGISQLVLTAVLLVRPSWMVLLGGGILHAGIALVWILSRTVGLGFVPGAEQAAPVGVGDVVANTFSIAVVGATVIGLSIYRSREHVSLSTSTARWIKLVTLVGVVILTVAALSEPHDIAQHHSEVSIPTPSHSHDHDATP